jgi:hypothetical protein
MEGKSHMSRHILTDDQVVNLRAHGLQQVLLPPIGLHAGLLEYPRRIRPEVCQPRVLPRL